jgi:tRNA modification GTPase
VTIPHLDDTVAAIATAHGRGAVAMLRLSGPRAAPILLALCPTLEGRLPPPRVQRLLSLYHPSTGELIDRALVSWFPGPASYTGDDTVEISTHGGVLTPQLVLDGLLAAGARLALPGEFTQRALLNGKIDLLQAEAVADLIDGRSRALHRAALTQMDRGLSHRIDALRDAILQVEALVVYGIDFPEEDEPPVPPEHVRTAADAVASGIQALLATSAQGEMLREGALLVLAGEPNSGKSSLFNALIGSERAIVTDVPGTTRDAIEATVEISGYPFRLVDTAGLRETEDRVEEIGVQVARRYLSAADLVLFCVPAGRALDGIEHAFAGTVDPARLLLVRTMGDLAPTGFAHREGEVTISSVTGAGLRDLADLLLQRAYSGLLEAPPDAPLVTRERHARALRNALEEVGLFVAAQESSVPSELAVTHLRAAAHALEELIGAVTPDDVLGRVFGQFCVGK